MDQNINNSSGQGIPLAEKPKSRSHTNLKEDTMVQDLSKLDEDGEKTTKKIKVGVCAMEKKVYSKPMMEILNRLRETQELEIMIFNENIIFDQPIENWPVVSCLISFFSKNFPMAKVQEYCDLRKPFLINDLKKQEWLWDRRKMYKELKTIGVPSARHFFVVRDPNEDFCSKYKYPEVKRSSQVGTNEGSENNNEDISPSPLNLHKSDSGARDTIRKHSHSVEQKIVHEEEKKEEEDDFSELMNYLNNDKTGEAAERERTSFPLVEEKRLTSEERQLQLIQELERSKKTRSLNLSKERAKKLINEMEAYEFGGKVEPLKGEENKLQKDKTMPLLSSENLVTEVEEHDDFIIINGKELKKPFVEKPFDAENHEVMIYYPKSEGGGRKRLFRKVGDISSTFEPTVTEIRKDGNYIYEEFLPTDGFDIKVYTVGDNYFHAEARKSPVLDGKVQRTKEGKEVRYAITLTPEEKSIARRISQWFGQNICGFDLLRSKGKSYVCDVNGWSFVKGSEKYYTDCSLCVRNMILKEFAPKRLDWYKKQQTNSSLKEGLTLNKPTWKRFRPESGNKTDREELRSVVAVFRHGDRTPKQKMKMKVRDPRFLSFFEGQKDLKKEVKLKNAKHLQKVLDITREILSEIKTIYPFRNEEDQEYKLKLLQLKSVLEKGGHFEEINRKVQLKPLEWEELADKNGKISLRVTQGLFIMKWGGELTHSGEIQAQELGKFFKESLYPQENEGILRLHSTYRHDMKIYSSDEGRCQNTAAAFCKGLLELEGELTPISVSMVRKDELGQKLLDVRGHDLLFLMEVKEKLSKLLNSPGSLLENFLAVIGGAEKISHPDMMKLIEEIGDPILRMKEIYMNICKLTEKILEDLHLTSSQLFNYYIQPGDNELGEKKEYVACGLESLILVYKRWKKIQIDFIKKDEKFDISKIPHVNDSIRYDMIHNWDYFNQYGEIAQNIFTHSDVLSRLVVPLEFGFTFEQKTEIGLQIIAPLMNKINSDLLWWTKLDTNNLNQEQVMDEQNYWVYKNEGSNKQAVKSDWRHIRTRLYFTSASHLYSLFNVMQFGLAPFLKASHPTNCEIPNLSPTQSSMNLPNVTEKKSELISTGGACGNSGLIEGNLQTSSSGINSASNNRWEEGNTLMLHYLSHMVFRLFENLKADSNDPSRFRLEVSLCSGCDPKEFKEFKEHLVPVLPQRIVNNEMNLEEFENLFSRLGRLEEEPVKKSN